MNYDCRLIKGFFIDWFYYCKPKPDTKPIPPPLDFKPKIECNPMPDIFIRCNLVGDLCICKDYRPLLWRK